MTRKVLVRRKTNQTINQPTNQPTKQPTRKRKQTRKHTREEKSRYENFKWQILYTRWAGYGEEKETSKAKLSPF